MNSVIDFVHGLKFGDLPAGVVSQSKRCLLDLIGVAAGARQTALSNIACDFAFRYLGSSTDHARILFDGRKASPIGAAYAGAASIDGLDAHDGHALTKGHAGVALLPVLLALADSTDAQPLDGQEFLLNLVLGYEIAARAGIALHASARDYHTSGAWNALGCAAMASRLLKLDRAKTREALGIAEYHGPRSQMMRCIDHPTMVKDGSGWGALAGLSAAYLARDWFTGAPAVTLTDQVSQDIWADLGTRWRIMEQYFKPDPICRWAQPAMEAARELRHEHKLDHASIAAIEIETFEAAVRLGSRAPATTEEAQYAIGFPVAAMFVRGQVGIEEITDAGLSDRDILALAEKITLKERPDFTARFPRERNAVVSLMLVDGTRLVSRITAARGDPDRPLSDEELLKKFQTLTAGLAPAHRQNIVEQVRALETEKSADRLLDLICCPTTQPSDARF